MIIDGRAIASEIIRALANQVSHLAVKPHLTVFTCAPNFETKKFLAIKKKQAIAAGVGINVIEFPDSITTDEVVQSVQHALMQTDGVIVQLPFPEHIDIAAVLQTIPVSYDVDAAHYNGTELEVLPPVVGAIKAIIDREDILLASRKVVIIGQGQLVGAPAAIWCMKQGAQVSVVTKESTDTNELLKDADIVIAGAGQPGLVTAAMVKDGVMIFDAGTSEDGGTLVGDVNSDVAKKASLFTPVPGGIGPITVAVLLKNLVTLAERKQ